VVPSRSPGGQRRYSRREIDQVVDVIQLLEEGLTLAGAQRVLALQARIGVLEADLAAARADGTGGSQDAPGPVEHSARRGE
jgi:MerR family transcriptional regulator/heat shock protein HspR